MNQTRIRGRWRPRDAEETAQLVNSVRERGECISVAGSCHAMGGQQFVRHGWLLDTQAMNRVLGFDRERGIIEVQAGITWPDLIRHYVIEQRHVSGGWGIRQKQTGADRLTIGGAIAANIHGRGLSYGPFVEDLESLQIVLADGSIVECDRSRNADLFALVTGGYGLFGVVTAARVRLAPRRKVQRVVQLRCLQEIEAAFEERIASGYLYGDFQFSTAPEDEGFLSRGVFSCYRPVDLATPIPADQLRLSPAQWRRLLYLAHRDKRRAFEEFADFYQRSSGQLYWSDTHQLSVYLDDYHGALDAVMQPDVAGSEMITELYVPRGRLATFMADVRRDFMRHAVNFIYGTVRLIRRDTTTRLAWARDDYACVIFNLHVDHDARGLAQSAAAFQRLIDIAIDHSGSYFLTYHRHATPLQLALCYPQFEEFLAAKLRHDPQQVFQSDWYRHYRDAFQRGV